MNEEEQNKTLKQGGLNQLFKHWASFSYDHAYWVLGGCIIILALLLSQFPNVKFDMSTEAMLHKSDPIRADYDQFKQLFGREDSIILSLETGLPRVC